jgi:Protein of unknown function (DUF3309)
MATSTTEPRRPGCRHKSQPAQSFSILRDMPLPLARQGFLCGAQDKLVRASAFCGASVVFFRSGGATQDNRSKNKRSVGRLGSHDVVLVRRDSVGGTPRYSRASGRARRHRRFPMLSTILVVVLILLLIGALPTWGWLAAQDERNPIRLRSERNPERLPLLSLHSDGVRHDRYRVA